MSSSYFSSDSINPTSFDFRPAGISDSSSYSTVMNQNMALQVPLGSQLNLLNAQNAGNPYLNYSRLQNQKLGSLQYALPGYGTLSYPMAQQGYASFGAAYGKY